MKLFHEGFDASFSIVVEIFAFFAAVTSTFAKSYVKGHSCNYAICYIESATLDFVGVALEIARLSLAVFDLFAFLAAVTLTFAEKLGQRSF